MATRPLHVIGSLQYGDVLAGNSGSSNARLAQARQQPRALDCLPEKCVACRTSCRLVCSACGGHPRARRGRHCPLCAWHISSIPPDCVRLSTRLICQLFGSLVTTALAIVPTPDDHEYARLMIAIEYRKRRIDLLQTERDGLETALSRFAIQLNSRVGGLRAELARVRLQAAEYRRRIERLRADDTVDQASLEQEVAAEFLEREERARAEEAAHAREGTRIERTRKSIRLDPQSEADLVRVYRELAKRFHPDLARTDSERTRRAELMLRINVAYSDRDLLSLQSIARRAESSDPVFAALTAAERLTWAQRVVTRLDGQIEDLQDQLGLLQRSETYSLWQSPESSLANIEAREARVRQRLTRERDRLDEAILDYNRILRRRRMPRTANVGT